MEHAKVAKAGLRMITCDLLGKSSLRRTYREDRGVQVFAFAFCECLQVRVCVCGCVGVCVCVRVPAHVIIQISVDKDIDMGILPKVSLEAKWEDDPKQAFNSEPLLTKESQPRPVRTA